VETSLIQNVWRILQRQHIFTACMKHEILMNTILKVITSQFGASHGSINSVVDSTDDHNNVLNQRKADYIDEPNADLQLESSDLPVATVNFADPPTALDDDKWTAADTGATVALAIFIFLLGLSYCLCCRRRGTHENGYPRYGYCCHTIHREPHQVSIEQFAHYQSPEIHQIQSGRNTPTSNILFPSMASPRQQQPLSLQPREPPIRPSEPASQRYLLLSFDSHSETSRLGAASQQAQSHLTIDIPADQVEKDARLFVSHYEQASGRSIDPEKKQQIVDTAMKAIKELQ